MKNVHNIQVSNRLSNSSGKKFKPLVILDNTNQLLQLLWLNTTKMLIEGRVVAEAKKKKGG